MAETAAVPTNFKKVFLLEKYDPFQGIATGTATAEAPDRDKEELVYDESKPFFQAWSDSVHKDSGGKSVGNVRRQHDDKIVAGKLNAIEFNDDAKMIRVEAKIVEPVTKDMLEQGCLTGFSIGGRYVKKYPANKDGIVRYVADPCEISVVDRPALPGAVFQSVKSDGSFELRKFAKYEKSSGESFGDISSAIQGALNRKYSAGNNRWIWIRDIFKETVVYSINDIGGAPFDGDELFECTYEVTNGDECTLGEPTEVRTTYVPADKAATAETVEALTETLALLKSGDIERSNVEISALLADLEKTMADKTNDELKLDKAARHSVHQKIAACKAAHTKHLEMCKAHHDSMHAHMDGISKVLGGGPESTHEGGTADEVTEGRGSGAPQVPGGSDVADKGVKYVSVGKDDKGDELFKRVEEDRPLKLSDIQELGKAIVKQVLDVQKAGVEAIGDRSKVTPFVKAATKEDDGAPADQGNSGREEMTKADWEAYGQGNREAIAKAQRCTANKWQPTPSRIANREADRVGAN
jgi:hypothetical protein